MEALTAERFLSPGYGSGSGDGSGDGDGDGSGYGRGYGIGYGDGYGDGRGDGYGDGRGDGYGISRLAGNTVHQIDGVSTIIKSIKGDVAKGFILQVDLTLKPCWIAKVNGHHAHGETLEQAVRDAQNKAFEDMDEDDRIEAFREFAVGRDTFTGYELFEWHGKLTGSCEMGRKSFVDERSIELDKSYTLAWFVNLTKRSYGGDVIARLEDQHDH